jgi:hypothetical protein
MILVYIRLPKRSASPACTHSPAERKPTLVGSLAYLVDVGTDTETVGGQVHRRARFGSRRALSSSSGSAPIVASSNATSMVAHSSLLGEATSCPYRKPPDTPLVG